MKLAIQSQWINRSTVIALLFVTMYGGLAGILVTRIRRSNDLIAQQNDLAQQHIAAMRSDRELVATRLAVSQHPDMSRDPKTSESATQDQALGRQVADLANLIRANFGPSTLPAATERRLKEFAGILSQPDDWPKTSDEPHAYGVY